MFIRTEKGNKLDYTVCKDPYVEPLSPEEWTLCIKTAADEIQVIASFSTVAKANRALDSLRSAIKEKHGWDAKEHQNSSSVKTSLPSKKS